MKRTKPSAVTATGAATPSPAAMQITPGHVRVGDGYARSFAVCGYPAEVGPAWPHPVLSYPARVDAALHIDPVPAPIAAGMLNTQRARLESTRRVEATSGKLADPNVAAAADDAAELADRVARGASKLHNVAFYATAHARTPDELDRTSDGVRAAAAGTLLDLQPATFRHQLGYTSTLPLGVDALGMRRIMDTDALAAAFPFACADLAAPAPGQICGTEAVLYGVNTTSAGVLMWNRWEQDNHNMVVLARSGAGKSYFVKCDLMRLMYQGVWASVIDPEDEYTALAEHVGGTVIRLGEPGVRINPFDLPADPSPNTLHLRQQAAHTAITVMLGGSDSQPAVSDTEKNALDAAIIATYERAGITHDPATWTRPAPLLRDLAATLDDVGEAGRQVANRLTRWTRGSFSALFDGPSTVRPGGHLTVWSLRHLSDELRGIGTYLALDHVWRDIDVPTNPSAVRRRVVVVDEAWLLMRDPLGAKFLQTMAKSARKRHAGLTVITQDAADVLATHLGMAVVSNAATQVLMRQSTQSIAAVTKAFGLTGGEARLLLSAGRGEALLVAGRSRVPFRSVARGREHDLAATGIGGDQ